MKTLIGIYGASGCGRGIMPLARAQLAASADHELLFIDDRLNGASCNGHKVVSFEAFRELEAEAKAVAVAIADPRVRRRIVGIVSDTGLAFFEVRAAGVVQMDDVEIGEGALLSPSVIITSNIRIGRHFHANLGSFVEHDCVIGDFVTFAPGVRCNGNVRIGDLAYVGAGAVIRQGSPGAPLVIGEGAVVGMGAVVIRDVPAGATVVGNPARLLQR